MRGGVLILVGTVWLLLASGSVAGDNNYLYLTQTGDSGTTGNSFFADQSGSNDSYITASQSGSGNVAHIVMGDLCSGLLSTPCGVVNLTQNNNGIETSEPSFAAGGGLARNYVSVTTSGDSTATVTQGGDGNSAILDVLDGRGTIHQTGNDNVASLTVKDGTNGTIVQNNNHNSGALEVTGTLGAGASLTQNGGETYTGPLVINTITPGVVQIVQN